MNADSFEPGHEFREQAVFRIEEALRMIRMRSPMALGSCWNTSVAISSNIFSVALEEKKTLENGTGNLNPPAGGTGKLSNRSFLKP